MQKGQGHTHNSAETSAGAQRHCLQECLVPLPGHASASSILSAAGSHCPLEQVSPLQHHDSQTHLQEGGNSTILNSHKPIRQDHLENKCHNKIKAMDIMLKKPASALRRFDSCCCFPSLFSPNTCKFSQRSLALQWEPFAAS